MLKFRFVLQATPVCCDCDNPIEDLDHAVFIAEAEGGVTQGVMHLWCAQSMRSEIAQLEERAGAVIADIYRGIV